MAKAANDVLVCGLINGRIALVDIGRIQIARILERAHLGTVVACVALNSTLREYVVT